MTTIGFMILTDPPEARLSWNSVPLVGYGDYTYDFPILRAEIPEAKIGNIIESPDDSLASAVVEVAQKMEQQGVSAIIGGCGFLALFQQVVAKAVKVPVAMSSLLQVPLVSKFIGKERKVGIITWSRRSLGEKQFNGAGWSSKDIPIVIGKGMDEFPSWASQSFNPSMIKKLEADLIEIARELLEEHADIGAFVLECAAIPGFARAIQKTTRLPVFSLSTLVKLVFSGINFI